MAPEPTAAEVDARIDRLLSGREKTPPQLSLAEAEAEESGDEDAEHFTPEVTVAEMDAQLDRLLSGRGLHSFTSQLNLSAFYGIGGARRGCVARAKGVLWDVQGE